MCKSSVTQNFFEVAIFLTSARNKWDTLFWRKATAHVLLCPTNHFVFVVDNPSHIFANSHSKWYLLKSSPFWSILQFNVLPSANKRTRSAATGSCLEALSSAFSDRDALADEYHCCIRFPAFFHSTTESLNLIGQKACTVQTIVPAVAWMICLH